MCKTFHWQKEKKMILKVYSIGNPIGKRKGKMIQIIYYIMLGKQRDWGVTNLLFTLYRKDILFWSRIWKDVFVIL